MVLLLLTATTGPAIASEIPLRLSGTGPATTFSLTAEPGDYLEGTLESSAVPADLHLVDEQGRPLRHLLKATGGHTVFRFVAASGQPRLRVTTQGGAHGDYVLSLTRRVAARDLAPPAPEMASAPIARAAETLARGEGTEEFWAMAQASGTPLAETLPDGRVLLTFVARGAARNVWLFGGPAGNHEPMDRLGNSDIWYKSAAVPPATRLSYRIAPDVPEIPGSPGERRAAILATAQADPFNRHSWPVDAPDAFSRDSLVELPDAPPQPWIIERGAPKGALRTLRFASAELGNERDITIYTPAGFDPNRRDTVLLFVFDAREYLSAIPTPTILDNLVAAGRLPPVVAVFIANASREARARELPSQVFARAVATDLLPAVLRLTGVRHDPARTALAGSSFGGLAAVTMAVAYPQAFGNALAMSGSFWWSPPGTPPDRAEHMAQRIIALPRLPLRFHLNAGLFEIAHRDSAGILDTSRHLRDVLTAKGYPVSYREYAAGHDYMSWRGALADGLLDLFGIIPPPPSG